MIIWGFIVSKIWLFMMIASLFAIVLTEPAQAIMLMMGASENGIKMCIEFLGIYAIWLGILQVLDDTKLSHKLSYLLRKPIRWIFGQTDEETEKNILMQKLIEISQKELDAREYEIIAMRYGIGNKPSLTQQEVADKLKISRSYVSRLEKHALSVIKKIALEQEIYVIL